MRGIVQRLLFKHPLNGERQCAVPQSETLLFLPRSSYSGYGRLSSTEGY